MSANQPSFIEQARRAQIVETTIETIAAIGLSGASLGTIAKRAGVSTGVLTYHFANKDDLIEQSIKKLFEAPNAFVVARVDGQGTHRERLRSYVTATLEFMRSNREYAVALVYCQGAAGSDANLSRMVTRHHGQIRKYVGRLLRAGQEAGEFRSFEVAPMAGLVFASIEGLMLQWVIDTDALDMDQTGEELVATMESRILVSA